MKNLICLPITFLLINLFTGCIDKLDENNIPKTMETMKVSSTFDWQTTHDVQFNITADVSTMVRIRSVNGDLLYHQGFYSTLPDPYQVQLNLPKTVTQLFINNTPVTILSNLVAVHLTSQPPTTAPFRMQLLQNPLVHWKLDEASGDQINDEYGLLTGTANSCTRVSGINGGAMEFDGVASQVRIANSAAFNPLNDQISFALWFKMSEAGSSGTFLFHNTKYILKLDAQGRLTFALYVPTYKDVVMSFADRILDTDWHQMVAVYDGTKMKLYLDTRLMATNDVSGDIKSSGAPIFIGSQNTMNFFKGQLDDIQIFGYALSEAELSALYTSTRNPGDGSDQLIAHWSLNENQGTTATDETGRNHGVIFQPEWTTGISGSCLKFNGTSTYVSIPNSASLNPVESISMMAWVKASENKTTKIVQKGDWDGHGLGQGKWDGWQASIRTADDQSHSLHWLGGLPVFNEWYHLAMTYDGSILKFYVNGQLRNSKAVQGQLKVNGRTVSIGSDNGAQKFFTGAIDEVKILGKALSQAEIQTNYSYSQAPSYDRDGDGIADADDNYPGDPARAFDNYYPVAGYGSLAFEDLWPSKGDYDFNDLVVDYRFKIITNAANKVSDVIAEFVIKAIGAGFENGFGFQLEGNTVSPNDIRVEGTVLHENYIQLNENGTEAGQEEITVIVFDNANRCMPSESGFGVNVFPDKPYITPDTIRLTLGLAPNRYTINDLSLYNFNPFLIINKDRGKEVHLPNRKPTSLANTAYFGTEHDNSSPTAGRYYKTSENLPWALNISSAYDHTIESVQISDAHLKFAPWAESSGQEFRDWFMNLPGYRNSTKIYFPKN